MHFCEQLYINFWRKQTENVVCGENLAESFVCGEKQANKIVYGEKGTNMKCATPSLWRNIWQKMLSLEKKEHCGEKLGRQFCLWRKKSKYEVETNLEKKLQMKFGERGTNIRCACATRLLTERCGLASSPPWQTDPDAFASFFTFFFFCFFSTLTDWP